MPVHTTVGRGRGGLINITHAGRVFDLRWMGTLRESLEISAMRTTRFTPDYLARAAEQPGCDESTAGQQKRLEDLALVQELVAAKPTSHMLRPAFWLGSSR